MPVLDALKTYPKEIALAAGSFVASHATFYVVSVWLISYATTQLNYDRDTVSFGLPRRLFDERDRFLQAAEGEPNAFLQQRVRWLVLEQGDDAFRRVTARWIKDGRAVARVELGSLTIIEILGD